MCLSAVNRDLKHSRRRRQGRRLEKMSFYFTLKFRSCLDLFTTSIGLRTCSSLICNASIQFQKKMRKISLCSSRPPTYAELTESFHVVVLQRTAKKCTKIYNARAELLFFPLNLLFSDVADAVLVCLRSLMLSSLFGIILSDNPPNCSILGAARKSHVPSDVWTCLIYNTNVR